MQKEKPFKDIIATLIYDYINHIKQLIKSFKKKIVKS